jgi:hypothetical protein
MNIDTKIECAKREVKRRKKFYPYMVKTEKLTQEEADFEIATMQEILETLTQFKGMVSA